MRLAVCVLARDFEDEFADFACRHWSRGAFVLCGVKECAPIYFGGSSPGSNRTGNLRC